ncbi:carboxymuconolactone decarboxylase family protein [Streptomyces sp. 4N509B]|uniref:carboxymuconolactone decarboxylase family protein n=1 Tax=Streptomyces sp. 4N509B TaxID=3457413 RepID=UPI003FCF5C51
MARISLTPRRSVVLRIGEWYSRRRYGKVLDPGLVYGHNPRVLRSYFGLETRAARWNALDPALKHLAVMVSSLRIGCSWCVDFGYWEAAQLGLPAEKIAMVPTWREYPGTFTETERGVMEYAEAMTETPPAVTDEMVERLLASLGEAALVELSAIVALENFRSRVNNAMGLTSQGFSESCSVRAPGVGAAE